MPVDTDDDSKLRVFTADEIEEMHIRTFGVRDGRHPTQVMKVDGRTMTRTFRIAWNRIDQFAELVLGNEVLYTDSATSERKLSRLMPDLKYGRHPKHKQIMATEILSVKGAASAGIDDDDGLPAYADAEVEVAYELMPFAMSSANAPTTAREMSQFVQLDGSVSGETESFGPIPGGAMKAARSGGGGLSNQPVPYNFSIMQSVEHLTLIWRKLPYECVTSLGALNKRLNAGDPADAAMKPYRGTVNSLAMTFGSFGRTFEAGTMLLDRTEFRTRRSPLGENDTLGLRADVLFYYLYRPLGWLNLFLYDPAGASTGYYQMGSGTYVAVASFPDDTGLYSVRDHNKLFDTRY